MGISCMALLWGPLIICRGYGLPDSHTHHFFLVRWVYSCLLVWVSSFTASRAGDSWVRMVTFHTMHAVTWLGLSWFTLQK